jgi:hypothetical protein
MAGGAFMHYTLPLHTLGHEQPTTHNSDHDTSRRCHTRRQRLWLNWACCHLYMNRSTHPVQPQLWVSHAAEPFPCAPTRFGPGCIHEQRICTNLNCLNRSTSAWQSKTQPPQEGQEDSAWTSWKRLN